MVFSFHVREPQHLEQHDWPEDRALTAQGSLSDRKTAVRSFGAPILALETRTDKVEQ
jgi:hypothetical protein